MPKYVWTRNNKQGVDTVHLAGCRHNLLPDRHTGAHPTELHADTLDEAQREIADYMGWDNWPNDHDAAFELRIAPCAR